MGKTKNINTENREATEVKERAYNKHLHMKNLHHRLEREKLSYYLARYQQNCMAHFNFITQYILLQILYHKNTMKT
jgi:hypothetical protein